MVSIDASGLPYALLNKEIRKKIKEGVQTITLTNVNGQRYIACAAGAESKFLINGVPGNDLGVYMDGAEVVVLSNVQDAAANTMNRGKMVIHGSTGDTLCYAMRGGEVFVRDNTGYRAGIHMKAFENKRPLLVVGGSTGDFLGEYMAGGVIVVWNLQKGRATGNYCGTGMHGGTIYIAGGISENALGQGAKISALTQEDNIFLNKTRLEFMDYFNLSVPPLEELNMTKIVPKDSRPYKDYYTKF